MNKMTRAGFRIALLQLKVGPNKSENVANALSKIRSAAKDNGARVVALPECFNSPYGTQHFAQYAEEIPSGETSCSLSAVAKELGIYLIGGTIPEKSNAENKIYNTCTVWSPEGSLIATYRKIHLFDINIPGGITFRESDVLTGGDKLAVVPIDGAKVGIGICYDMRFEELARLYRNQGCDMLIYPGAFNMKTGPLHWELLARGRATDTQSYVATISPARDASAGYISWGHSMVVDPWAKIIASAAEGEEMVLADIDFGKVDEVREQIPISSQRRTDLYSTRLQDS
ncbi:omega-amidase NIT2 [Toxorhynchites rutilus septentrionalis]|uniref:omega-amidase NIT2 n=1 Tax=Toxorhynchites rutilus septentrionalis TaxID=329112 RepID=UPI00247A2C6A|nr:omega-amidase NIT2 [Toxorhynchites rutilus septentrionalis]